MTSAATLGDGVAFAWDGTRPDKEDRERDDVRYRMFDADGLPLSDEDSLTPGNDGPQVHALLGTGEDGALLVAWREHFTVAKVRRRGAAGVWLDDASITVSTEWHPVEQIAAAGGRYALSITTAPYGGRGDVQLGILDAETGALDVVPVSMVEDVAEDDGRVVSLPAQAGEGWLYAWTDENHIDVEDTGAGVLARRYTPDGTAVGERFIVPTNIAEHQRLQAMVRGPGGVLLVWTDNSRADGLRRYALRARLLPNDFFGQ